MNPQRVVTWIVISGALALSVYLGNCIVQSEPAEIVFSVGVVGLVLWTLFAGEYWWTLVPAAVAFGGLFYYGFKIYFHEIALILCLLPLGPLFIFKKQVAFKARPPLPWFIHGMSLFMLLHCGYSIFYTPSGWGNILRAEMQALWPLIFFYPFYYFGSTRVITITLIVLYLALLGRWVIELCSYFDPGFTYLPGLNFVPSQDAAVLRYSSLYLLTIAWSCFIYIRSPIWRIWHVLVAVSTTGTCLLGSGRSALIALLCLPLIWAGAFRKWWLVMLAGLFFSSAVLWINSRPEMIEGFPAPISRSLSVLILQPHVLQVQREQEGSNEWHEKLRQRAFDGLWQSPIHTLFGYPLEPFVDLAAARFVNPWEKFEYMVDVAARAGGYESGLASVLGIYGITGMIFYLLVFADCMRGWLGSIRTGVTKGVSGVFYLMAFSHCAIWLVLSWVAGGIPSLPLMFALIAKVIYMDRNKGEEGPKTEGG